MKITFERLALVIIILALAYSWFYSDNSNEKIIMEQNEKLVYEIASIEKRFDSLQIELGKLQRDTVIIVKNYITNIKQADSLIKIDSSNANKIIRYKLGERKLDINEYSTMPLTNEELALVSVALIDLKKQKDLLSNALNREAIYEMQLIEKDRIIALEREKIKNYANLIEEIRPAWYEKPLVVMAGTATIIIGIFATL